MESTPLTVQQINRAIDKIVAKYPASDEDIAFTDIHLKVVQESGEMLAFNDDEKEINRCVIEDWIDNNEDEFYPQVAQILRDCLQAKSESIHNMGIAKPFSFVLEDDDNESIAELFIADDETIIIGGDLMGELDSDLDSFFEDLMRE